MIPSHVILWFDTRCIVRTLRKIMCWIFAIQCFFFALVVWIVHYPPQYGQTFIRGGLKSPLLTIIEVSSFYVAVIVTFGVAWWTNWKEKESYRVWGIAASILSLFMYVDPSYWYQIQRKGVWLHWAICLFGLATFLLPQPARSEVISSCYEATRPRNDAHNGSICYSLGVLYPAIYLLSVPRSKQDRFYRFHCFQCLFLFALLGPLLPVRSGPVSYVSDVLCPILAVGWFIALVQAQKGRMFRLPVLGYFADRLA